MNDISISHIALESLIDYERLMRDTLIEQYKIMYPGLKYGDSDILQETLSMSKDLTCGFFSSYKNTTKTKLNLCLNKLTSLYGVYASLASSTKVNHDDFSPYNKFIYIHNRNDYDNSVPDLSVLQNAISDIGSDYERFVKDDDEKIKSLCSDMKNVDKTNVKNICSAKSKMDVDDVYKYIKSTMIGAESKVMLDYELVSSAKGYGKKFSGNIKTIKGLIDKYLHLIDKMVDRLDHHIITTDLTSISDINLDYADPENMFFRYELTKLSTVLNATTQVFYAQIDCISSEIEEKMRILQEFIKERNEFEKVSR